MKHLLLIAFFALPMIATGNPPADGSGDNLNLLTNDYVAVQEALAADQFDAAIAAAKKLEATASSPAVQKINPALTKAVKVSAGKVAKAGKITTARKEFKNTSKAILKVIAKNKPEGFEVYECPMAAARWVQKSGAVRNPYYGKEMLDCGDKVN